jgi:hypothetical protein
MEMTKPKPVKLFSSFPYVVKARIENLWKFLGVVFWTKGGKEGISFYFWLNR